MRTFTVEEYHWLIAQDFFAQDERFELLDGLIVNKMARDPIHDASLAASRRVLDARLPTGWHVRVQSAVTTGSSEPEPDLAIVRGTEFDYVSRHPGAADAELHMRVEVYTDPSGPDPAPTDRRRRDFSIGASILLTIANAAVAPIAVADLLPPAAATPLGPQP
jgi:hypothetical protein